MSLKEVKEIEKNLRELTLSIDKETFDAEVMKVYRKQASKITVPGFRKGKAPKHIIEKMYGQSFFHADALDALFPEVYEAAVKEAGLEVVSRPEVELESIDENGVVLKAKVYVKPEVKVNKYKGLSAEKEAVTVEDSEIDADIEAARKRLARVSTLTEGAAENGDEAVIDFEGFVDGVAFEGGKGEKYPLKLGSGSFIPGFEEQIVGKSVGESFDISVKFPEEYGAENLAGKDAVFKIVLHEIKRTELPELDEDFVKDVSEFDTVDEYKADIKAKIEAKKEKAAEYAYEEGLLDDLLANTELDLPAPMVEDEIDMNVRDYEYRLQMQGGSLQLYFQYTGQTMEQLRESFRPQSERQLKIRLALESVVAAENIEASEEDIEAEYNKIAEGYKTDLEKVKATLSADTLVKDIVLRKAVDLIKENAAK
ncbi:MAG: trigger factor [Ruminococcaceae bacterium]|nr:trigger factor [Oscillospiraceae bacterium]